MGAKRSCRSPNGGGYPFLYALHIAGTKKGGLIPSLSVRNIWLILISIFSQPCLYRLCVCCLEKILVACAAYLPPTKVVSLRNFSIQPLCVGNVSIWQHVNKLSILYISSWKRSTTDDAPAHSIPLNIGFVLLRSNLIKIDNFHCIFHFYKDLSFTLWVPREWYLQAFVPVSQCKDTHNFDKTNIFSKNICLLWCFLGKIGDNKGRNLNIFLKSRKEGRVSRWSAGCPLACPLVAGGRVHWVQVVRLSRLQDLLDAGGGPLVVCSLPFVSFVALHLVRCLRICLYFAF